MKHATIILAASLGLLPAAAPAQPIAWRGAPFFASSRGTPLANVLKDLGANYGLAVVISPKINDTFSGAVRDSAPGVALSELSRMYQLLPYYDGNTLYLYKAQEVDQALLAPAELSATTLVRQINASGLLDGAACQLRLLPGSGAAQLNGVPACLSRVTALARQLEAQDQAQEQNKEVVSLYPLKYANATDTSYPYRDQTVVVPGVVTVLRAITQGRALSPAGDKSPEAAPLNTTASSAGPNAVPSFSADPRQNAVLIRDRKKNIGLYNDLIAKLDQRTSLIEISVSIIDVNASDIKNLGVDWTGAARLGGGKVSFNSDSGLASDNFSSVVANSASFMVRLNALAEQAKAKIVSRPSVVTLDNVQAVLDRNTTFYTKVSSEHNADLKSVTAGTLMRVTPRLVHEQGQEQVFLTLNIQDGRQGPPASAAEGLPQVLNAEIATQATLTSGQALLLGGFVQSDDEESVRKIPLLGDLPLIGSLFRSKSHTVRNVVRLFLIKAEPRTPG